jgi:predicted XRE-type DNA-binding protein
MDGRRVGLSSRLSVDTVDSTLMAERKITQTETAGLVDMKQPDFSKLLRGRFKLVSVEKLMRMLTAFDHDVEITVKPHRKRGEAGRIIFIPA